ncbi:MAG: polysaccharide deacetylase family protein [Oligoflexia bacterium]|nr:polysaccharide deacetylase family protein [Oligoflexia bacterium]
MKFLLSFFSLILLNNTAFAEPTYLPETEVISAEVNAMRDLVDAHIITGNAKALHEGLLDLYALKKAERNGDYAQVKRILKGRDRACFNDQELNYYATNELTGKELQTKEVVLTFDDGPHPTLTIAMANLLERNRIDGTFFQVGRNIKAYPHVSQELHSRGFLLANHSWSHQNFKNLSDASINAQIDNTQNILLSVMGGIDSLNQFYRNHFAQGFDLNRVLQAPEFLRTPYGSRDKRVLDLILANTVSQTCRGSECRPNRLNHAMWLIDSLDWSDKNPVSITNRVFKQLGMYGNRGIILFHEIHPQTYKALEIIIPRLIVEGYRIVTIYDALKAQKMTRIDPPGSIRLRAL